MNRDEVVSLFVRELHGELTTEERTESARLRKESPEFANLYVELEAIKLAARAHDELLATPSIDLTDRILGRVDEDRTKPLDWRHLSLPKTFAAGAGALSLAMLVFLIVNDSSAPGMGAPSPARKTDGRITYNDSKITNSVNAVLLYAEGSFGALMMTVSGLIGLGFTIAWLGSRKSRYGWIALCFLLVSIAAFALRRAIGTFFNDRAIGF